MPHDVPSPISAIHELLYRLGITANYTGFFQTAYAVQLSIQQPERLLLVTKWLYPEVARYYGTTWVCVERNTRSAAEVAWRNNRQLLETLAHRSLPRRPTASEFLADLTAYLQHDSVA